MQTHRIEVDIAAVMAGNAAELAAWEAHLEGRPMTWLELRP